jgi:hypothetical protein
MASTSSSREAALERRKALTSGGKKAESRYTSAPVRVRTAADAKPARTEARPGAAAATTTAAAPVTSLPQRTRPAARSGLSVSAPPSGIRGGHGIAKPLANPSRELVLARREALSRRGKRADSSKDRTRTDLKPAGGSAPNAASAPPASAPPRAAARPVAVAPQSTSLGQGSSLAARSGGERRNGKNRSVQYNPSRALVLARREALSKRGKSASIPGSTSTAAVARQGNPDLSTRELAQKVRDLKSRVGSAGSARNGGCRPCGPNRNGSRQEAAIAARASAPAADAHWKVGVSETSAGQMVTGTQANRSARTTGNESSTCRPITGTEYLGAEIFNSFCQSGPLAVQPAKVRVSSTSHGNVVTGNEVGRSEKVTGDEPGTCKNVTGTEYISANQSAALCGVSQPSPRKVGHSQTLAGRPVSGVVVGRSERVTGDEPGSGRHLTGTQYVNEPAQVPGRAPTKVSTLQTLRGTAVTGTHVGRSEFVTGDEPGSCRMVTGDEYVGSQQYDSFCGVKPAPEPAKVGFSVTNRNLVVSGTRTGRSEKVTGDEPGTCKAVTGTPYAGMEDVGTWCPTNQVAQVRQRTPVRMGTVMSGIQPGIGGAMTGAERGACEDVTGTPYVGGDQLAQACGTARHGDADFPQPLGSQPWQQFSVQSPARAAQLARERPGGVTGTSYEQGSRITGPFDLAGGKVTGTEEFRFDRRGPQLSRGPLLPRGPIAAAAPAPSSPNPMSPAPNRIDPVGPVSLAPVSMDEDLRPTSRVTGEGISAGLKITGDDWDRGKHVTGTEGASARRRNPSRPGAMQAMPSAQPKRNERLPEPVSRVTGSSGNTMAGSLITVSGGARG